MSERPEPVEPNTPEEWDLEQRVFHGAGHQDLPKWAHSLISDLWREVVAREKWFNEKERQ